MRRLINLWRGLVLWVQSLTVMKSFCIVLLSAFFINTMMWSGGYAQALDDQRNKDKHQHDVLYQNPGYLSPQAAQNGPYKQQLDPTTNQTLLINRTDGTIAGIRDNATGMTLMYVKDKNDPTKITTIVTDKDGNRLGSFEGTKSFADVKKAGITETPQNGPTKRGPEVRKQRRGGDDVAPGDTIKDGDKTGSSGQPGSDGLSKGISDWLTAYNNADPATQASMLKDAGLSAQQVKAMSKETQEKLAAYLKSKEDKDKGGITARGLAQRRGGLSAFMDMVRSGATMSLQNLVSFFSKKTNPDGTQALVSMADIQAAAAANGVTLIASQTDMGGLADASANGPVIAHLAGSKGQPGSFVLVTNVSNGNVTFTSADGKHRYTVTEDQFKKMGFDGKILSTKAEGTGLSGSAATATKGNFVTRLLGSIWKAFKSAATPAATPPATGPTPRVAKSKAQTPPAATPPAATPPVANPPTGPTPVAPTTQPPAATSPDASTVITNVKKWMYDFLHADAATQAAMLAKLGLTAGVLASLGLTVASIAKSLAQNGDKIISYLEAQGDKIFNCAVDALGGLLTGSNKNGLTLNMILVDMVTGGLTDQAAAGAQRIQFSFLAINTTAKVNGLTLTAANTNMAGLGQATAGGKPVIVHLNGDSTGHFVTVTGISNGTVYYTDSDGTKKSMSEADFAKSWSGDILTQAPVTAPGTRTLNARQQATIRGAGTQSVGYKAANNEYNQKGATLQQKQDALAQLIALAAGGDADAKALLKKILGDNKTDPSLIAMIVNDPTMRSFLNSLIADKSTSTTVLKAIMGSTDESLKVGAGRAIMYSGANITDKKWALDILFGVPSAHSLLTELATNWNSTDKEILKYMMDHGPRDISFASAKTLLIKNQGYQKEAMAMLQGVMGDPTAAWSDRVAAATILANSKNADTTVKGQSDTARNLAAQWLIDVANGTIASDAATMQKAHAALVTMANDGDGNTSDAILLKLAKYKDSNGAVDDSIAIPAAKMFIYTGKNQKDKDALITYLAGVAPGDKKVEGLLEDLAKNKKSGQGTLEDLRDCGIAVVSIYACGTLLNNNWDTSNSKARLLAWMNDTSGNTSMVLRIEAAGQLLSSANVDDTTKESAITLLDQEASVIYVGDGGDTAAMQAAQKYLKDYAATSTNNTVLFFLLYHCKYAPARAMAGTTIINSKASMTDKQYAITFLDGLAPTDSYAESALKTIATNTRDVPVLKALLNCNDKKVVIAAALTCVTKINDEGAKELGVVKLLGLLSDPTCATQASAALLQVAQDKNSGKTILQWLTGLSGDKNFTMGAALTDSLRIAAAKTLVTGGFDQNAQNMGMDLLFHYANGDDGYTADPAMKQKAIDTLSAVAGTSGLSQTTLYRLADCGIQQIQVQAWESIVLSPYAQSSNDPNDTHSKDYALKQLHDRAKTDPAAMTALRNIAGSSSANLSQKTLQTIIGYGADFSAIVVTALKTGSLGKYGNMTDGTSFNAYCVRQLIQCAKGSYTDADGNVVNLSDTDRKSARGYLKDIAGNSDASEAVQTILMKLNPGDDPSFGDIAITAATTITLGKKYSESAKNAAVDTLLAYAGANGQSVPGESPADKAEARAKLGLIAKSPGLSAANIRKLAVCGIGSIEIPALASEIGNKNFKPDEQTAALQRLNLYSDGQKDSEGTQFKKTAEDALVGITQRMDVSQTILAWMKDHCMDPVANMATCYALVLRFYSSKDGKDALQDLIAFAKSTNADTKKTALRYLTNLTEPEYATEPVLVSLLECGIGSIAIAAAQTLLGLSKDNVPFYQAAQNLALAKLLAYGSGNVPGADAGDKKLAHDALLAVAKGPYTDAAILQTLIGLTDLKDFGDICVAACVTALTGNQHGTFDQKLQAAALAQLLSFYHSTDPDMAAFKDTVLGALRTVAQSPNTSVAILKILETCGIPEIEVDASLGVLMSNASDTDKLAAYGYLKKFILEDSDQKGAAIAALKTAAGNNKESQAVLQLFIDCGIPEVVIIAETTAATGNYDIKFKKAAAQALLDVAAQGPAGPYYTMVVAALKTIADNTNTDVNILNTLMNCGIASVEIAACQTIINGKFTGNLDGVRGRLDSATPYITALRQQAMDKLMGYALGGTADAGAALQDLKNIGGNPKSDSWVLAALMTCGIAGVEIIAAKSMVLSNYDYATYKTQALEILLGYANGGTDNAQAAFDAMLSLAGDKDLYGEALLWLMNADVTLVKVNSDSVQSIQITAASTILVSGNFDQNGKDLAIAMLLNCALNGTADDKKAAMAALKDAAKNTKASLKTLNMLMDCGIASIEIMAAETLFTTTDNGNVKAACIDNLLLFAQDASDQDAMAAAIKALTEITGKTADQDTLLRLMTCGVIPVEIAAAVSLALNGDPGKDDDQSVRDMAIQHLMDIATSNSPYKAAAISSLVSVAGSQYATIPSLTSMMNCGIVSVEISAATTLLMQIKDTNNQDLQDQALDKLFSIVNFVDPYTGAQSPYKQAAILALQNVAGDYTNIDGDWETLPGYGMSLASLRRLAGCGIASVEKIANETLNLRARHGLSC